MSKRHDQAGALRKRQAGKDKMYPTQKLLNSSHLAGYQKDFAKVILTEPAYTISEAKAVLDRELKKGKDKSALMGKGGR